VVDSQPALSRGGDVDKNVTLPPLDSVSMKLKNAYYRTMYHSLSPTCTEELCQQNATHFRLVFNEIFLNAEVGVNQVIYLVSTFREDQHITAYFNICHI